MLDLYSRWVLHLEVRMEPHPKEAPVLNLRDELGHLFTAFETGHAVQLINSDTAAIRIRDIRHQRNDDALVILFNYSDKNISDPVFEELETGTLRTEPKLEGEGVAVSAHMAIALETVTPGAAAYKAVLEDVPGIGRSKITPFLKFLYRNSTRIQWMAPDGSVKNCRPMFDILGRMSDSLRNDLAEGKLSWIEFVQHHVEGDLFDEEGEVREQVRTIRLSVAPNTSGIAAVDLLNRLKGKARDMGYPNMRVRWTHGKQKTTEFGTQREDAGDVLVFKTTEIKSEDALAQCEERIRDETARRLIEILRQEQEADE